MKKTIGTLIATALIISLLLSLLGFSAAAKGNDLIYVSLGDSIALGIGLPDNPLRGPDQENKELIYCYKTPGCYPVLIAEELGIADENFYQLACAGMRTVELRHALDRTYVMPNHDANNFQGDELKTYVMDKYDYADIISNADIVTLNMCANDIATCALFAIREAMISEGVSDKLIDSLTEKNILCGECSKALCVLLSYASKLESFGKIAAAAINGLNEGYVRWAENWDAICDKIYELNGDVKLICIGMFNPFSDMKLSSSSLTKIGSALNGIVEAINSYSACGSPYADKYTYVSAMGVESMLSEKGKSITDEDFLDSFELDVHLSQKGQRQVAERVLSVIDETETPTTLLGRIITVRKKTVGLLSRTVTRWLGQIERIKQVIR